MWFIILSDILFHQKFRNAPASVLNLLPPPHGGKLQWLPLNGTAGLRLRKNCLLGLLSLPLSGKFASCALVHGAWQKEFGFLVPWPAKVYSFISSSLNCMVKVSFRITKFLDSHFCRFIKLYFNTYLHSILWITSSSCERSAIASGFFFSTGWQLKFINLQYNSRNWGTWYTNAMEI